MILSILAKHSKNNRKFIKTAIIFMVVSAFCIAVNKIYAIFGHGVHSASMSYMFLYPLVGGTLIYLLLQLISPGSYKIKHFRVLYNLYNSGIATLAVGSMLKGIFEIAGTASGYTVLYFIIGYVMLVGAITGFIIIQNIYKLDGAAS